MSGSGVPTAVVQSPAEPFRLPASQRRLIKWTIYLGFAAFAVAVLNGLDQALNYAGISILKWFPGMRTYYQGLTVHGVFNAIVLTFAFTNGFLALTTARGLGRKLSTGLLASTLASMVLGVALAGWAMFTGRASVLYTFYPPLQAHWTFYAGLALLVVSTWLTSANLFVALSAWRKEHPGERIPLMAFISVCTYVMWDIASIGIAIEVVGLLLPWSLGLIGGADPLLSRTLFWYTGHPIVYFWLLPAYVSWYVMIPRQVGGKLFSDSVTRVVFILFIVLSIPVGMHHQYQDPGIPSGMKAIQGFLTFGVFFPSLITAFSVMAALEMGGRSRGGKGLLGWIWALPWGDPSVSAQLLAMLTFMLGGITGLINASYTINRVVHNTTFIPGHFHLTVGSAVALSFMGIAYWLIPYLTDRKLWGRRLAVAQTWLYGVGVLVLARGLISGGLEGMPRRTFVALSPYNNGQWDLAGILTGIGGTLMFASVVLFFIVLGGTLLLGARSEEQEIPFTETMTAPALDGWEVKLDKFRYWVAVTVTLILLAYGPFLASYLPG
ncbi:MAG TPA: cbb3-type cytochrome c oxidase subunit I, partial [Gemmatimonadota bacterium]|nr:cbb3-type cytochrome c oxidase subunit I [Gemmatimonadota bacterium]